MTATMGCLTPLIPTTPSKQWSCGTCTTKNSCVVPSTTKTTTLPMTSTSCQRLTPHQQARERSTTSPRSHNVSAPSDTPKDFKLAIENYDGRSNPSIWLKMYSIAAHASRGNEDHMAGYSPVVMGKAPLVWLDNLLESASPPTQHHLAFSEPITTQPIIYLVTLTTSP
jgi:hypothetical protein